MSDASDISVMFVLMSHWRAEMSKDGTSTWQCQCGQKLMGMGDEHHLSHMSHELGKAGYISKEDQQKFLRLLDSFVDSDDCSFDHHGGCQEHGYLALKPGEKCPHREAKELLEEHDYQGEKDG